MQRNDVDHFRHGFRTHFDVKLQSWILVINQKKAAVYQDHTETYANPDITTDYGNQICR